MKKKLIAIAIAGVVAAPLTAQASSHGADAADIKISADARVRYYDNNISEMNKSSTMAFKGAQTDSRVGININASNSDGAVAVARLELKDTHGDAGANVAAGAPTKGPSSSLGIERAYIAANVAGLRIMAGQTVGDWGHKLYSWDSAADRVHIVKKMGDMAGGIVFTKHKESGLPNAGAINQMMAGAATSPGGSKDDDTDFSVTTLFFKMGKMGGIRYDMKEMLKTPGTTDDVSWNVIDLYGGAPLGGGWGLGFEFTKESGDKTGQGMLLAAMGDVGGTGVTVGYASAADGFATDDDLFTFAGTGAEVGSMLTGLGSAKDVNAMSAMFAMADFAVVEGTSLNVAAGQITNVDKSAAATADTKETVISFKVDHKLGKVTSLNAQLGSFSGDMIGATHYGASISTKF